MARRSSRYPTELELEILKILWRNGPLLVRQVRKELAQFRDLAHTSVMTMLTIMTEKGYLKRSKKSNRYIYKPIVTEEEITSGIIGDIVNRVFDGSASALVTHLLQQTRPDSGELDDIRKTIAEFPRKKGGA